jgi:hypothetical protein
MSNWISFECPERVKTHPDVRVEMIDVYSGGRAIPVVSEAFIKGCRACQQVLSKCQCGPARVESEKLLWNRDDGKLTQMYLAIFKQ